MTIQSNNISKLYIKGMANPPYLLYNPKKNYTVVKITIISKKLDYFYLYYIY